MICLNWNLSNKIENAIFGIKYFTGNSSSCNKCRGKSNEHSNDDSFESSHWTIPINASYETKRKQNSYDIFY